MPTDEELVQAIPRGDSAAVAELSSRYRTPLLRFAGSILNDPGRAEDVVQEVFAILAAGADLPAGAVRPWLYRVTRNRAYDILRRGLRSPTGVRLQTDVDATVATTGIATRVARRERDAVIREIVAAMPDDYREVVTLKYFEDLSRDEISQVLDLTDAAVKGRLARGLEHLRNELRRLTGTAL